MFEDPIYEEDMSDGSDDPNEQDTSEYDIEELLSIKRTLKRMLQMPKQIAITTIFSSVNNDAITFENVLGKALEIAKEIEESPPEEDVGGKIEECIGWFMASLYMSEK